MSVQFKADSSIGYIVFDNPQAKVNVLNADTIHQLDMIISNVNTNPVVKVLVLMSAKRDVFVAGADIK
ncbi:MAG: hypothetical protein JNN05_02415, partial [Candidatus Omnitrophica bacterium]|nr:hypothetical protein [Candidatus Omnitrophota bacterium]